MKYEESFTESSVDVVGLMKKAVPSSFIDQLRDAGVKFEFPNDSEFEFKVKYDISEEGGSCTLKVSWDNELYVEEDEEDEEEEDEEKEED